MPKPIAALVITDSEARQVAREQLSAVRYLGSTGNGEQYSVDPLSVATEITIARCRCGWTAYFGSPSLAPSRCPECNADLPEVDVG